MSGPADAVIVSYLAVTAKVPRGFLLGRLVGCSLRNSTDLHSELPAMLPFRRLAGDGAIRDLHE